MNKIWSIIKKVVFLLIRGFELIDRVIAAEEKIQSEYTKEIEYLNKYFEKKVGGGTVIDTVLESRQTVMEFAAFYKKHEKVFQVIKTLVNSKTINDKDFLINIFEKCSKDKKSEAKPFVKERELTDIMDSLKGKI